MADGKGASKRTTGRGKRRAAAGPGKKSSSRSGGKSGEATAFDGAESMDPERDAAARAQLQASDKLYYRIGEVSRLTGVKAHVLRYWETEFRWMAPPKSRSKQRLYRKRDIEFVWLLKRLLWGERYTIAGARQRIQDLGVDDALALLDQPMGAAAKATAETAVSAEAFASLRVALEDMKSELLGVRAALSEGL